MQPLEFDEPERAEIPIAIGPDPRALLPSLPRPRSSDTPDYRLAAIRGRLRENWPSVLAADRPGARGSLTDRAIGKSLNPDLAQRPRRAQPDHRPRRLPRAKAISRSLSA